MACNTGKLDVAIYNAGNNFPGRIIDMEAEYFKDAWKVCCLGGFLFGREAIRRMQPNTKGVDDNTGDQRAAAPALPGTVAPPQMTLEQQGSRGVETERHTEKDQAGGCHEFLLST